MVISSAAALRLADLFDPALLAGMVEQGYVRVQRHPSAPLVIHNYTEKCQYESVWNRVTLACRGLVSTVDGTVLARPFPKFFNHGQPDAPPVPLDAPVVVTDKEDGSLGIVYHDGTGYAVATRGSFASDQAQHATAVLRERYATWAPPPGRTVLVEIIYPGNRIVLDYGGLDDLVLLGSVDLMTGTTSGPGSVPDWPGPVVESFDYPTLADALAAPPRAGREGLVVWFPGLDLRLKIKYAEYIQLHKIVTGLNARTVWERIDDLDALIEPLPDELHTWVRSVAAELHAEVDAAAAAVEEAYESIVDGLPDGWSRKDFAAAAVRHPLRGCLFLRLDGKDYRPVLWQQARPDVS
jgi:RNA ligase